MIHSDSECVCSQCITELCLESYPSPAAVSGLVGRSTVSVVTADRHYGQTDACKEIKDLSVNLAPLAFKLQLNCFQPAVVTCLVLCIPLFSVLLLCLFLLVLPHITPFLFSSSPSFCFYTSSYLLPTQSYLPSSIDRAQLSPQNMLNVFSSGDEYWCI